MAHLHESDNDILQCARDSVEVDFQLGSIAAAKVVDLGHILETST